MTKRIVGGGTVGFISARNPDNEEGHRIDFELCFIKPYSAEALLQTHSLETH